MMLPWFLVLACVLLTSPTLAGDDRNAAAGKALFERVWVSSSSATRSDSGLGPLYDAPSCNSCHVAGGPGQQSQEIGSGYVVRLGSTEGAPDPNYGFQLQTHALAGLQPESVVKIDWALRGEWRITRLALSDLPFGPLDPNTNAALRRAPSLAGIAELAAISDDEILSHAALEISRGGTGHVALLKDHKGKFAIGRWGWKAATSDLGAQIALAMQRDMGLSTTLHPQPWGECTAAEQACRRAARRKERKVDAPDAVRNLLVAYLTSIPAPIPMNAAAPGFAVFQRIGCDACHATLKSRNGADVWAMSDLLLHDMGPDLYDGIAEGAAKPSEWRTAPLWTIVEELAGGGLLHDGRARNIAEAVHWHGGEAAPARTKYEGLNGTERGQLDAFLLQR